MKLEPFLSNRQLSKLFKSYGTLRFIITAFLDFTRPEF
jgi:hypothetical protein